MSLKATRLELEGFRGYSSFGLDLDPALTILVGPNAIGKTNIIEALQLLTAAESFRKPQWSEIISWDDEQAHLTLIAEGDGRSLRTELRVGISGKREYQVNGKLRRRISDVAGILSCVLFTPDDLRLIKDSAERRRSTLDSLGVQLSPSYRALKAEYERLIRQRNAALRDTGRDIAVVNALTSRVIGVGSSFMAARVRLFERLRPRMSELYHTLSHGEELQIRYVPSWASPEGIEGEEQIKMMLSESYGKRGSEELMRGTTLVGPHKDDVVFTVDGRDARVYASQGQQRTVALAWKLAEVAVVKDVSGQPPLLLLDDVMSELDEERRQNLAAMVGETAQTFMTTTNLGYFSSELVNRAFVVNLP